MKFQAIFFLLLLTCMYLSLAQEEKVKFQEILSQCYRNNHPKVEGEKKYKFPENQRHDVSVINYSYSPDGSYGNCCLGHVKKMRKYARQNIESYRMQETDGDCNLRAVVFQIKKRPSQDKQPNICANPQEPWVQALIKGVDRRMQQ